eukprot:3824038-Amphidinium_carterae.1
MQTVRQRTQTVRQQFRDFWPLSKVHKILENVEQKWMQWGCCVFGGGEGVEMELYTPGAARAAGAGKSQKGYLLPS